MTATTVPSVALVALVATSVASSCASTQALPGTLRGDVEQKDVEKVGELQVERSAFHSCWGLDSDSDKHRFAAEMIRQVRAKKGDGAMNLVYESRQDGCDLACTLASLGFFAPRSYSIKGDIVRIAAPPVPGDSIRDKPRPALPVEPDPNSDGDDDGLVAQRY